MSSKLCPFCMRMAEGDTCPHCGKNINYAGMPMHLPAGYVVSGTHPYVIGAALGQGGFGITYIALDMVTGDRVAIKEYFPTFCSGRSGGNSVTPYQNQEQTFEKGRERFLDEARVLKSLSDLKCIVNVLDFFEFNNSAYLVMEFLEGSSLKDHVAKNGKFPAQEFLSQIQPLMEDIERMHQRGVVHRDIAPDNIMLLPDGQMKLIDFGTARSFIGDRSMTVVVKKGFAPLEQYLTKGTTPSTDVYALAATIYYCITGTVPMDSAERQYDGTSLESPSALGADITPLQEKALAKALEIQQKARTQSVQEFLDNLNKEPEEPKPEPVKQKEPVHTIPEEQLKPETKKKKPVWIAAAAILAVVATFSSFALLGRDRDGSNTDIETESSEVYSSPTAQTPSDSETETLATVSNVIVERDPIVLGNGIELPREETLCFAGQQWGEVASWNIIGANPNNAMAIAAGTGYRTTMFETLYMWDVLSGTMKGLLANDDWAWNDDMTALTLTIKDAAHWSDGTTVTGADVVRTWTIGVETGNGSGATYGAYIDSIVADGQKVIINCKLDGAGVPVNPLKVLDFLVLAPIAQADWIDTLVERCGGDATAILNDPGEDVVWSGPYTKFYADEQIVVLIRDDNYWGQDDTMWGKLPVPKYLAHALYGDNAAGEAALKAGEVDVCQQFIGNIQDLWEEDGLPISTYYDEAPYGVCVTMPTAWYNMNIPVIANNPALRKAIAMAVDYDAIIANAMTNQSPSFSDVPRSLMNPTAGEQALYDHNAVADLQWVGNDVEGAKALLDEAGLIDTDGDGWREWNGGKITLNAVCPNGWSDWQASMEVVAAAGQKIGIEITTLYPEAMNYYTVFTDPDQTEYAIFMWSPDASTPSNPWGRVNQFMGKQYVGQPNNWSGNWGQYVNDEADALIKQIPTTTDEAALKELYTKLTEIYLTEVPSFSLMYRPSEFHAVNESVWTNFPSADDGRNIPPTCCTDGYGIAALYELKQAQ